MKVQSGKTKKMTEGNKDIVLIQDNTFKGDVGPSCFLQRAVQEGENVYVFGGENDAGFWTNTLHAFNAASNNWKSVSWNRPKCFEFPPKLDGHSMIGFGRNLVLFGGNDNQLVNGGNNTVYCINVDSFKWSILSDHGASENTPPGRKNHAATLVGSEMFVYGGQSNEMNSETTFSDVHSFNLETNSWSKVATKGETIPALSGHSMVFHPATNSLIVFGGRIGQDYSPNVWVFNLEKKELSKIETSGDIPKAREKHSATLVDDMMYIYGGWTVGGPSSEIFCLDLSAMRWTTFTHNQSGNADVKRFGHTCILRDGMLEIFGGKNHKFQNQSAILKINLNSLIKDSCEDVVTSNVAPNITSLQLDLDEEELFSKLKKHNYENLQVTKYKSIFEDLTGDQIKTYEELDALLQKQSEFQHHVQQLQERYNMGMSNNGEELKPIEVEIVKEEITIGSTSNVEEKVEELKTNMEENKPLEVVEQQPQEVQKEDTLQVIASQKQLVNESTKQETGTQPTLEEPKKEIKSQPSSSNGQSTVDQKPTKPKSGKKKNKKKR